MKCHLIFRILLFIIAPYSIYAQSASLSGTVEGTDGPIAYAAVILDGDLVYYTDDEGTYRFNQIDIGDHKIEVSYLGYEDYNATITIYEASLATHDIILQSALLLFDEVVVTGSKTFKRKTNSAVIVNVVDSKTLDHVQACNLSEGLRFQTGLRVETDCQTCNYTQLRMNGLAGGYSQILVNGRPIFSPLTGLYGLEQIPVNMIDRIEVVRGAGSSLYGSSAIGGTVNVLTKIPRKNNALINTSLQSINGMANDLMIQGNGTIVNASGNGGLSLFINRREREAYDHNGDNFSELPELQNTSVGLSGFILPTPDQKIEWSISHLNEYRYGGEMVDKVAHLSQQAEERLHNIWMSSLDYQINMNDDHTSLISYAALQHTARDHYTGIIPDTEEEQAYLDHISRPPYGQSVTSTLQAGVQINHKCDNNITGTQVWTLGVEYLVDDTYDEIESYQYLIDQETRDLGLFAQNDWDILPSLNLQSGLRIDKHNLVDGLLISPRLSLLYKIGGNAQLRASYGTGFRAPQAFDTDLHIAFAGGGVSRVLLSDDLKEERSRSYSLSLNYDKPTERWVAGGTIEAFHTRLDDAFNLDPVGEDDFGEVFVKRNGTGAIVQGVTMELRANYNRQAQIEMGVTIQSSEYQEIIEYIDEVEGVVDFIRTPNVYGFANLSLTPSDRWSANLNYIYTGSMLVPHFAGAPNQQVDEIITSSVFGELSTRVGCRIPMSDGMSVELYSGVKNLTNSYQDDFDIGKNRDSNFVYGPGQPRTIFAGIKWNM